MAGRTRETTRLQVSTATHLASLHARATVGDSDTACPPIRLKRIFPGRLTLKSACRDRPSAPLRCRRPRSLFSWIKAAEPLHPFPLFAD